MKDDNKLSEYFNFLNNEKKVWQEKIRSSIKNKDFLNIDKAVIKSLPKELNSSLIKKFASKKIEKLSNLSGKLKEEKTFHEIRKCLKDLLYNWPYLKDNKKFLLNLLKKEGIKKMINDIGNFLDKNSQIKLLKKGNLSSIKNEKEKIFLMNDQKKKLTRKIL